MRGKEISGPVGPINHRVRKDGTTIVQSKGKKPKQTKDTKKLASLFGMSSIFSKAIRYDLAQIYMANNDVGMINRLNTAVRAIFEHHFNIEDETFDFDEHSFDRLAGFEFNLESLLIDSLWVKPQVSLTENVLTVNLAPMKVQKDLKFPKDADTCNINVGVAMYAINEGYHSAKIASTVQVFAKDKIIPAQSWTFDVPDGCYCVVSIALVFSKPYMGMRAVLNNSKFFPATICVVVKTNGVFSLEQNKRWQKISNLRLNAADSEGNTELETTAKKEPTVYEILEKKAARSAAKVTKIKETKAREESIALETVLTVAANMKSINLPVDDIALATGLSIEDIERL